jgi:hypothetical protein
MNNELNEVRNFFNRSPFEKEKCDSLISAVEGKTDFLMLGYAAAGKMMSTKHMVNPFARMKPFNQGKDMLDKIIAENPAEPELRFLRYTFQQQVPRFLGYYRNIEEDRNLLSTYIKSNPDSDLTKHMMVYLLDTKDVLVG